MANHRRQDADAERTGRYLQRVGHTDLFLSSNSVVYAAFDASRPLFILPVSSLENKVRRVDGVLAR